MKINKAEVDSWNKSWNERNSKKLESPLKIRKRVRWLIEDKTINTWNIKWLMYTHSLKVAKIITYLAWN